MSQHRDPVVADALRRLDVPEHSPDFWARLESRLADDVTAGAEAPPTTEEEATVVDLQSSPAARRAADRRRTPMLALAAAVVIVVALVVGAAILGGGGDDESQLDVAETTETTAPEDTATTAPEDTTDTTAPEQTTTTAVPDEDAATVAEQTAVAWIDALFAGDTDGAYDLLDDASRAAMTQAELEEVASGLFEGAAAFAQEGITRDVTELQAPDGAFHVVTFSGEVEREGMVETASYPVVVTGTGVHFTLDGPQVELEPGYAQSSGTTLASPLELLVGEETDAWIWFDGGDPEPLDGRGQVSVDVEASAGAGTHLVSVAAVQGDRITARAFTVVVP